MGTAEAGTEEVDDMVGLIFRFRKGLEPPFEAIGLQGRCERLQKDRRCALCVRFYLG